MQVWSSLQNTFICCSSYNMDVDCKCDQVFKTSSYAVVLITWMLIASVIKSSKHLLMLQWYELGLQPHKVHLNFKLIYKWFSSYLLCTFLLFPFHLLPSPVHPTRFSFCVFPCFRAIFTLLSSNNNNNNSLFLQTVKIGLYPLFWSHFKSSEKKKNSCTRNKSFEMRKKNTIRGTHDQIRAYYFV